MFRISFERYLILLIYSNIKILIHFTSSSHDKKGVCVYIYIYIYIYINENKFTLRKFIFHLLSHMFLFPLFLQF